MTIMPGCLNRDISSLDGVIIPWMLLRPLLLVPLFLCGFPASGAGVEGTPSTPTASIQPEPVRLKLDEYLTTPSATNDIWNLTPYDIRYGGRYDPPYVKVPLDRIKFRIRIRWSVMYETNIRGYTLFRAESPNGEKVRRLNPEKLFHCPKSSQSKATEYLFYDLDIVPGKTYYYRISAVNNRGNHSWAIGKLKALAGKPKVIKPDEIQQIRDEGCWGCRELPNPENDSTPVVSSKSTEAVKNRGPDDPMHDDDATTQGK